jgi:ATP-dependent Clp protease ATP-binding subunit ClpB
MLQEQDVQLDVTPSAIDYIADEGYDPTFGARPVKRAIQKLLLNELSKKLLSGHIDKEKPIIVDSFGDGLVFRN